MRAENELVSSGVELIVSERKIFLGCGIQLHLGLGHVRSLVGFERFHLVLQLDEGVDLFLQCAVVVQQREIPRVFFLQKISHQLVVGNELFRFQLLSENLCVLSVLHKPELFLESGARTLLGHCELLGRLVQLIDAPRSERPVCLLILRNGC